MSLKRLLRYLANDGIIEQLANTPVVRRGAQLTHYAYQRGMKKLTDISETGRISSGGKPTSLSSFTRTFARNLQKEIEKEMKK